MTTIDEVMTAGHRTCDRYFAAAEAAVADGDWPGAEDAWRRFVRVLDKHITGLEEGLLFPAFEEVNGPAGPTSWWNRCALHLQPGTSRHFSDLPKR